LSRVDTSHGTRVDDRRAAGGFSRPFSRLTQLTAQLRCTSKVLYWVEHYSSLPSVEIAVMVAVVCLLGILAGLDFPNRLETVFQVAVSAITLVMVLTI
jgi:hypothetical protein